MGLTNEERIKSCFSFTRKNTEEVIPAKHVNEAALTFKGKKKELRYMCM